MRLLPFLVLELTSSSVARSAQVDDATAVAMAQPQELVIASDIEAGEKAGLMAAADAFYGFWINGSPALLDKALSPAFVDHTLPLGRPQGPAGPAAASKVFLTAIPDLKIAVVQRLAVGDRVVSHLRFTGHFTGIFEGVQGRGQAVNFIATDILRVRGNRITDNWHLEDNLTFLQEIGFVSKP